MGNTNKIEEDILNPKIFTRNKRAMSQTNTCVFFSLYELPKA